MFSASVWPVTVRTSPDSFPAPSNSVSTAGTPPARWKLSPRYLPAGCMLTRSGISKPWAQSPAVSSTPAWRAIAMTCGCALVEPPIAAIAVIALRKASRVRMRDGRRSSCAISTIRLPVRYAICARSRYGAGIAAHPGNDIPSASATAFMVDAVPMVLQCPADGAEASAASKNVSSSIWPVARRRRLLQMMVPEPTNSPSNQPSSIGPPESTIAGMSTVAAAMIAEGVVLSQPVVNTTASIG